MIKYHTPTIYIEPVVTETEFAKYQSGLKIIREYNSHLCIYIDNNDAVIVTL